MHPRYGQSNRFISRVKQHVQVGMGRSGCNFITASIIRSNYENLAKEISKTRFILATKTTKSSNKTVKDYHNESSYRWRGKILISKGLIKLKLNYKMTKQKLLLRNKN